MFYPKVTRKSIVILFICFVLMLSAIGVMFIIDFINMNNSTFVKPILNKIYHHKSINNNIDNNNNNNNHDDIHISHSSLSHNDKENGNFIKHNQNFNNNNNNNDKITFNKHNHHHHHQFSQNNRKRYDISIYDTNTNKNSNNNHNKDHLKHTTQQIQQFQQQPQHDHKTDHFLAKTGTYLSNIDDDLTREIDTNEDDLINNNKKNKFNNNNFYANSDTIYIDDYDRLNERNDANINGNRMVNPKLNVDNLNDDDLPDLSNIDYFETIILDHKQQQQKQNQHDQQEKQTDQLRMNGNIHSKSSNVDKILVITKNYDSTNHRFGAAINKDQTDLQRFANTGKSLNSNGHNLNDRQHDEKLHNRNAIGISNPILSKNGDTERKSNDRIDDDFDNETIGSGSGDFIDDTETDDDSIVINNDGGGGGGGGTSVGNRNHQMKNNFKNGRRNGHNYLNRQKIPSTLSTYRYYNRNGGNRFNYIQNHNKNNTSNLNNSTNENLNHNINGLNKHKHRKYRLENRNENFYSVSSEITSNLSNQTLKPLNLTSMNSKMLITPTEVTQMTVNNRLPLPLQYIDTGIINTTIIQSNTTIKNLTVSAIASEQRNNRINKLDSNRQPLLSTLATSLYGFGAISSSMSTENGQAAILKTSATATDTTSTAAVGSSDNGNNQKQWLSPSIISTSREIVTPTHQHLSPYEHSLVGNTHGSSGISLLNGGGDHQNGAWLETRARRIMGNVKKSEERSRQLLLCEEAGGGELCRMLFKGHVNE